MTRKRVNLLLSFGLKIICAELHNFWKCQSWFEISPKQIHEMRSNLSSFDPFLELSQTISRCTREKERKKTNKNNQKDKWNDDKKNTITRSCQLQWPWAKQSHPFVQSFPVNHNQMANVFLIYKFLNNIYRLQVIQKYKSILCKNKRNSNKLFENVSSLLKLGNPLLIAVHLNKWCW